MIRYSWGVDGYGRAHICERNGCAALFCMLPGYHGGLGALMLDDQYLRSNKHKGNEMNIINNHVELAALASSYDTSIEVMEVIADKANGDINEINEIFIMGDKELEAKAFEKTEETELNWGLETIYRNQGE